MLIDPGSLPEKCLHRTQCRAQRASVNTFSPQTLPIASAQTGVTIGLCIGVITHMVGTNQLIVMRSVKNLTAYACFLPPTLDLQDNTGCQLIIEIIQVADLRLKIFQNLPQFPSCFKGIDDFDGVAQLLKPGSVVKIHGCNICTRSISNNTVPAVHAKVLYLMSLGL